MELKRGLLLAFNRQKAKSRLDPFVQSDAATLPEAAYRFCRHERGVDVVLTGTGNPEHLKENSGAILKAPLPKAVLGKLETIFGKLDQITSN